MGTLMGKNGKSQHDYYRYVICKMIKKIPHVNEMSLEKLKNVLKEKAKRYANIRNRLDNEGIRCTVNHTFATKMLAGKTWTQIADAYIETYEIKHFKTDEQVAKMIINNHLIKHGAADNDTKNINDLKQIIYTFGKDAQVIKSIEEMSELIKELSKYYNEHFYNLERLKNINDEMADVEIMLNQLKIIFDNESEVDKIIKEKIKRTYERYGINNGKEK